MPVTKQQKKDILADLEKSFEGAKSVVFSQYQGTKVKDMRELRKKLRAENVMFKVARKTLMEIAAKKIGFNEIPSSFMQGPIGLAFGMKDEVAPARIVHEFAKTHETVKLVGAIFEGKLYAEAEAKAIASLPGREVLLAKLMGSMKAPISGFYSVLHGVLSGFVRTLDGYSKKKTVA
jgi:large subunit ribosomal protein L10